MYNPIYNLVFPKPFMLNSNSFLMYSIFGKFLQRFLGYSSRSHKDIQYCSRELDVFGSSIPSGTFT